MELLQEIKYCRKEEKLFLFLHNSKKDQKIAPKEQFLHFSTIF